MRKFTTTDTIRTQWHIKRLIIGMEYILQRVKIYKTVIKFLTQLFLFFFHTSVCNDKGKKIL